MHYKTDLIGRPQQGTDELRHPNGNTDDIVKTVLYADKRSAGYTKEFAATLKGSKIIDTCKNIWQFVKTQIPYVLDKRGYQWVKSPGRLWAEKAGDCKSFSVFVGSCLQNLNIPYGFRFASYKANDSTATHVYVYVPHQGGEILIDAVWDGRFNTEKKYAFKQDIMSEIHYLGEVDGIGGRRRRERRAARRAAAEPQLAPLPFAQPGEYIQPNGFVQPPPIYVSPAVPDQPAPVVYNTPVVTPPVVITPPAPPAPPRVVVTGVGFFGSRRRRRAAAAAAQYVPPPQPRYVPVYLQPGQYIAPDGSVQTQPGYMAPVVNPALPISPTVVTLPGAPLTPAVPPRVVITGVGRMSKKKKKNLALHLLFPSPSTQLFRKIFGKKKRKRQQAAEAAAQAAQLAPLPFPQGGAYPVPATVYTTPTSTVPYIPGNPLPETFAPPYPGYPALQPPAPVYPGMPITTVTPPAMVITGTDDYTELVLPRDVDKISDGEMDLLLARQRLAIEKANSARVGGPFNFQQDNYDKAIAVVNQALANLHNPDHIIGMGQTLDDHADAVGKKKGVGKFFKKIGAGLKKGLKAVAKVISAPQRLIIKGIMEIYLPKSAYLFLYLFADAPDKLPDVMKRKRAKAEKFKKFIVNGVGMKENHFMAIIRNSLTKKLGISPEKYLAQALVARVSGIGAAKRKSKARKSPKNKANSKNKRQAKAKVKRTNRPVPQYQDDEPDYSDSTDSGFDPDYKENPNPVRQGQGILSEENVEAGKSFVKNLGGGNWIGAIITAAMWIIKKIVGLFKKKKGGEDDPGTFTADDMPNLETDAANVFEYRDLHEDFSNVPDYRKYQIKDVATDLMLSRANERTIDLQLQNQLDYLTPNQRAEVKYEIYEGPEAIDEFEAAELANEIKDNGRDLSNAERNGGGSAPGLCQC